MASTAGSLGRLDLEVEWREWGEGRRELEGMRRKGKWGEDRKLVAEEWRIEGKRLEEARKRSDEVLVQGGVIYDKTTLTFLVSSPHLHRRRSREEEQRMEERRGVHRTAMEGMPHHTRWWLSERHMTPQFSASYQNLTVPRDMFHSTSYMNRLAVLRTDIAAQLCQGQTGLRNPR